jgi:stearoyl-CoA desaturase (delta-9 desaturase)
MTAGAGAMSISARSEPVTSTEARTRYDGAEPFPGSTRVTPAGQRRLQVAVTALIVILPFAGLAAAVTTLWGHGIGLVDVLLAVVLYLITGFGVTVGFHRLLTHRSFTASPWLRITLAIAGSMSFQGDVTGWVATHRRHHAFTDCPGDPHSPYRYGTGAGGQLRGLVHAHMGWMFRDDPTPADRYAPDLLADPGITRVARAFPALCAVSLLLPFSLGWALGGDLRDAWIALLWAGLVRVLLLHHVTWSVNSLCHMIGVRPHPSRRFDRSTDLWPLALISFGESWHNGHHAAPTCARHGSRPHQIDLSASLIRTFERLGWATGVHWPDASARPSPKAPAPQTPCQRKDQLTDS